MAKKIVIVGNWKMNKTPAEAKKFMTEFKKLYTAEKAKIGTNVKFGIGAPSVDLAEVKAGKASTTMIVAAQNMHFADNGAYTGELSAEMIKAAGANAVIIGHSERRAMFSETDLDVNKKTIKALESGLLPIVCVGETLEEFEMKKTQQVVKKQIVAAFKGLTQEQLNKVIIAYEPIWAIGTGKTATSAQAEVVCKYIRGLKLGKKDAELTLTKTVIQYGGSVKPENIAELMSQPNIDGALVGGASVDPKSFVKLLTLNK